MEFARRRASAIRARARPREGGFSLRDLSFAVEPGEIFGVIGPNSVGQDHAAPAAHARGERRPRARSGSTGGRSRRWPAPSWPGRSPWCRRTCRARFPFTVEQLVLMGRFPHAPRPLLRERRGPCAGPRAPWPPTGVLDLARPAARARSRRRAPARDARPRARPAAAAARARRADRAPRPALSGRSARRCCAAEPRAGHDGRCSSPTIWTSRPRCATACSCSMAGRVGAQSGPPEAVLDEACSERGVRLPVVGRARSTSGRPPSACAWPSASGAAHEGGDQRRDRRSESKVRRERGKPVRPQSRRPKPARSRHCEWGAPPRSRETRGATVRRAGPGRLGARRRSTSQETCPGCRASNPFEQKERSNATASS